MRHASCFRFYSLEGDVKREALDKVVASLGTAERPARIALGPSQVEARPKPRFLVLELPAQAEAADVRGALKKICPKVDELAWTAFESPHASLPTILGKTPLECVVGMDNDLRWFDLSGGRARFFYRPGQLDAQDIQKRYSRLYTPFEKGELGEIPAAALQWKLAEPVDAAAAKAAEKALAKLPGVRKARIDVAARTLTAEIVEDGLLDACAGSAPSSGLPATSFLVDDVLDVLDAGKIALEKR